MPTRRIEHAKPTASKVIERVLAKIDTDALADTLADKLAEKLLACINVDSLVDALHAKHRRIPGRNNYCHYRAHVENGWVFLFLVAPSHYLS